MEASASERDMPTSADFSAPQSLAPSPHMPQVGLQGRPWSSSSSRAFSSGFILANIYVFMSMVIARFACYSLFSESSIIFENARPVIAKVKLDSFSTCHGSLSSSSLTSSSSFLSSSLLLLLDRLTAKFPATSRSLKWFASSLSCSIFTESMMMVLYFLGTIYPSTCMGELSSPCSSSSLVLCC